MNFLTRPELKKHFAGKTVAIVGSAPTVLNNPPGLIDGHDVVVRCNNYKLIPPATGIRTTVYYSYFGNAVKKTVAELKRDGVKVCMCKVPDSKPIDCEWHERTGRLAGIDFRWVHKMRKNWWFTDTYVPSTEEFLVSFNMLGKHIPSTGFGAVHTILDLEPKQVYVTGFDGFRSGLHNVNEPWRTGHADDPIKHVPEVELSWFSRWFAEGRITVDRDLEKIFGEFTHA